ncbi:hypothetical protein DMH88_12130 [Escherichia coli]|nr:hypothetical protein [Escherichia coli]
MPSSPTTPPAPCYFIFVSDPAFDKGYAFDFFCLEPMSHAPDDHHRIRKVVTSLRLHRGISNFRMSLRLRCCNL